MPSELKSCPFCGGQAYLRERPEDRRRKPLVLNYYVVCLKSFTVDGCSASAKTKMFPSPELATVAWNTRAANGAAVSATPTDAATIHPDDLQDLINKFLLDNYACTIDHPAMHVLKEFVRWHPEIVAASEPAECPNCDYEMELQNVCENCGHRQQ